MKKDERQSGGPEQVAGSREPQRASRPAPGKVTRTSRIPSSREPAVQRKAAVPGSGAGGPQGRSAWDQTMDPWMDAAHRGVTALAAREHGAVQARGDIGSDDQASVHRAAAAGVSGAGGTLPHLDRIQAAFGAHDLGGVQAHTGSDARAASEQIGAEAYATGNHIAFRGAPDLHTAAHEAAHVIQQREGVHLAGGVGRSGDAYEQHADAVADAVVRGDSAEALLDQVAPASAGASAVQMQGMVVQKLDASNGNTEIITRITSLIGSPVAAAAANEVMQTLAAISENRLRLIIMYLERSGRYNDFITNLANPVSAGHAAVMMRISRLHTEYANPTAGTTPTTPGQDTRVAGILNQGMTVTASGQVAAFQDDVAGRTFTQDVRDTLEREITALTPRSQQRDIMPRFGWPRYEQIAQEAKRRTDALYGHYAIGTAPTATGPTPNLFDVRDQTYSDASLIQFANYLVTGHTAINPVYPGRTILNVHNASLNRAAERGILTSAITAWMGQGTNRDRILLVRRNWSGVQSGGNIFMQRWDMGSTQANRQQFWRTFRTMIHEYLHKVTNRHYSDKARTLGRTREQIFTEGGTSYFDRNVWQTLYPQEISSNAQLRETVEGAPYPYDASVIGTWSGYTQVSQFEQIVSEVGEENARAAYFRGLTDRIGLGP
jgi:hypothetical protein